MKSAGDYVYVRRGELIYVKVCEARLANVST